MKTSLIIDYNIIYHKSVVREDTNGRRDAFKYLVKVKSVQMLSKCGRRGLNVREIKLALHEVLQ
jgi:hypothetical protein